MTISSSDFNYVSDLVRRKSGIVLEAGKEYLVDARLTGLARQLNMVSVAVLVEKLRANPHDPLHKRVVEVMTTNETSFFRDLHPFETLRSTVLPELLLRRAAERQLAIWCAASSTGQEPYSIAMTLCEAIPRLEEWKITFVATDISSEMIARSRAGRYNQIEINRGLPAKMLVKHFQKQGLEWEAAPKLRSMIEFREMNLTQPWTGLGRFDIIFMRNVLIYFDSNTKREIFASTRRALKPDGYYFLGSAETTMGLDETFERAPYERSGCYRLKNTAPARAAA